MRSPGFTLSGALAKWSTETADDFNEYVRGMIKSRNVPGYEVDSLITSASFERKGAISWIALSKRVTSGSLLEFKGVGTQIVITEALAISAKSCEDLYSPLEIAA